MGPNVMIRFPPRKAGLAAMDVLISEILPSTPTEVMGLNPSDRRFAGMYDESPTDWQETQNIYSLITGIYDEYLHKW